VKEYEPDTRFPFVLFGSCSIDMKSIRYFPRLEGFSSQASGLLVLMDNGPFSAAALPLYFYLSRKMKMKITYCINL
jgi:hypothetical protein